MPSENGRKRRGAVVFQAEGHACEFLLGKRGVARVGADRASVAGAQMAVDGDWHEVGGACRAPSFDLTLRTVILSLKTRGSLWKAISTRSVVTGSESGLGKPL